MTRRLILVLVGTVVICLAMTSLALADAATWHTPQNIYDDYRDNNLLDGPGAPYTKEELQAYLGDAEVHQYGDRSVWEPLDKLVTTLLTTTESRSEFPFTGFQLMIAGIVAVVLVGGGIALRHLTRPHKS